MKTTKVSSENETANSVNTVLTAGNFKPILFSTPMVQSILRGEKKQTRRLCKFGKAYDIFHDGKHEVESEKTIENILPCKYKIGDILWVRETWQHTKCLSINFEDENYGFVYKADKQPWEDYENWTWKPSIFMPKEACRIFLKIKSIRIERLNDISENDSLQEGIQPFTKDNNLFKHGLDGWEWQSMTKYAKEAYKILWQKINGEKSWEENPFVWVYEFERTDDSFACS